MTDLVIKWTLISFLGSLTVAIVIGLLVCLLDFIVGRFNKFIDNRIKSTEWYFKQIVRDEIREINNRGK